MVDWQKTRVITLSVCYLLSKHYLNRGSLLMNWVIHSTGDELDSCKSDLKDSVSVYRGTVSSGVSSLDKSKKILSG